VTWVTTHAFLHVCPVFFEAALNSGLAMVFTGWGTRMMNVWQSVHIWNSIVNLRILPRRRPLIKKRI
jgi:hypothetical protein